MKSKNDVVKVGFLESIGETLTRWSLRFIPDAFIYAILLTWVTVILAWIFTPKNFLEIIFQWSQRFWGVLTFSMQSSYGLMFCTILAFAPILRRAFIKLAAIPKTHFQFQLINVVIATLLMSFHWGMLVAAGIFAREIAIAAKAKGIKVHYPLIVAGAYAGLLPWHLGLSGASQLLIATKGHPFEKQLGIIPVSQTLFHPYSYGAFFLLAIVTVVTIVLMTPKIEERIEEVPDEVLVVTEEKPMSRISGFWGTLFDTKALSTIIGILMLVAIIYDMAVFKRGWDLNLFVFLLYALSLLFHKSLNSFCEGLWQSVRAASQIFLQFQWYGGIMGLMLWSGLAVVIAKWFAGLSTPYTWGFWNWIQASVVNLFIPSGGGQFTATAAYMIEASRMLGVPFAPITITTFAMGDQWTNMIQPFWALPVISVAWIALRKIMGYCAVVLITTGIATALWIFIMPLFGLGG